MKYAISLLRLQEKDLQIKMIEYDLKSEEFSKLSPQFAGQREQFAHMKGLTDQRLKEVRAALEKLEK